VLEAVVTTKMVPVAAPNERFDVVANPNMALTLEAVFNTKVVPVAEVKVRPSSELKPLTVIEEMVVLLE
jgi:hypothetical protein